MESFLGIVFPGLIRVLGTVNLQVEVLKQVSQKELIDFFEEYIKVGSPGRKALSIRVYAKNHSSDMAQPSEGNKESNVVQIEDIFSFRKSMPLYGSFKGTFGLLKL